MQDLRVKAGIASENQELLQHPGSPRVSYFSCRFCAQTQTSPEPVFESIGLQTHLTLEVRIFAQPVSTKEMSPSRWGNLHFSKVVLFRQMPNTSTP